MSKAIPRNQLEEWRAHQVTRLVWKKLCNSYQPYQALRNCRPEDLKYHQGIADVLQDLAELFLDEEDFREIYGDEQISDKIYRDE